MGYNFGHRNLSSQTQEILRQKERAEKERQREAEERTKNLLKDEIINYLRVQTNPMSANDIAKLINEHSGKVLQALNELSKQNKVELVVDELENRPKYMIGRKQ